MSAKINYTHEAIGEPKMITDFLPSAAELTFRDEDVKIPAPRVSRAKPWPRPRPRTGARSSR